MTVEFYKHRDLTIIELKGDLRKFDSPQQQRAIFEHIDDNVRLQAQDLQYWDSTTVALLYQIMRRACKVEFVNCPQGLQKMAQLAIKVNRKPNNKMVLYDFFTETGEKVIGYGKNIANVTEFLKDLGAALLRLMRGKAYIRGSEWREAIANSGYRALGIVCLTCCMTGLILAFVGALQLRIFGAQVYIASLVTIAMIRIMGAIMTGVIMAGRFGAQSAAVIGAMKVNEELDALKTLGIAQEDMVVLPRVAALTLTCPFLVVFADIAGILGGMAVAIVMFDISPMQYGYYVAKAFSLPDFIIGIIHGGIYGFIIAVSGCYCGINCGRDAKSVGAAATMAVVASIVIMIVVTGILTWIIEGMGI